ncbi:Levanase precursor [Pirellula sp. SH-Sr6A]|uniref:glycoside hydrolase family 32 protein n=1 Tax=Pirellula sp. SH-Sr6A TaxID=1632865 RepID=UPI00078C30B6|nr:glycoside hydrolase family 32 protein [Pirellula sp. SH-Sr6A]AMV32176.1 Levanase precursor [Pirellula sp. SH-Sr6A]
MIQLRWARLLRRAPWFACWFVAFISCCSVLFGQAQETDILIADFESDTYGAWTTSGEAFGTAPARGALPGQMPVSGYRGDRLVNSFYQGDRTTGSLTSPPFQIERNFIAFLIGGGRDPMRLAFRLVVDGQIVRSATGPNDRPGGSEELSLEFWDVRDWKGKTGVLQIVDEATGGWGHINVDHVVNTDSQPAAPRVDASKEWDLRERYLLFPIKNGAKKRVVTFSVDGERIVRNEMELSDGPPDWWAPMDVSPWAGKKGTVVIDKLPGDSQGLELIRPSDRIPGDSPVYEETKRSQFHFSPMRGWNNDPNGLVYYQGNYHLFFQHNPYGWGWGNMHWGHAVSQDLVHWEELGDKLLPDDMGPMFSGSAVVDKNNTSGLGRDGKPPMVLFYTAAGTPTVQGLAYSHDGKTFQKLKSNPILHQVTPGNRDPKVIWHEPTKHWIMVLYVELPGKQHTVHFYRSPNLMDWTLASVVRGGIDGDKYLFECPDFFPLPVDDDPNDVKWVLLGADSQYAIGTFDGVTFQPEHSRLPGHRGRGFYAAQSFSDIPANDGRRILIGWFQTETKEMPFNQSMSIPLDLRLTKTSDGPRMTFRPIQELAQIRQKTQTFDLPLATTKSLNPLADLQGELWEVQFAATPSPDAILEWELRGEKLRYTHSSRILEGMGVQVSLPKETKTFGLQLFIDRNGLELFTADGQVYIPIPISFAPNNARLSFRVLQGETENVKIEAHALRSIWNKGSHR